MTRRSSHAHADEAVNLGTAGLGLFGQVGEPAPAVVPIAEASPSARRKAKAMSVQAAKYRRWIEHGKPIAMLLAAQDGQVTAETFRLAAERMPHALPPTYGQQRALAYLPVMFAELVVAGQLQKRRRADGSVVTAYSGEHRNQHVVYEPVTP